MKTVNKSTMYIAKTCLIIKLNKVYKIYSEFDLRGFGVLGFWGFEETLLAILDPDFYPEPYDWL